MKSLEDDEEMLDRKIECGREFTRHLEVPRPSTTLEEAEQSFMYVRDTLTTRFRNDTTQYEGLSSHPESRASHLVSTYGQSAVFGSQMSHQQPCMKESIA